MHSRREELCEKMYKILHKMFYLYWNFNFTSTQVGQEIEVRPGIVSKDPEGKLTCRPIFSRIVSLFAEQNDLQYAVPGGLIGMFFWSEMQVKYLRREEGNYVLSYQEDFVFGSTFSKQNGLLVFRFIRKTCTWWSPKSSQWKALRFLWKPALFMKNGAFHEKHCSFCENWCFSWKVLQFSWKVQCFSQKAHEKQLIEHKSAFWTWSFIEDRGKANKVYPIFLYLVVHMFGGACVVHVCVSGTYMCT